MTKRLAAKLAKPSSEDPVLGDLGEDGEGPAYPTDVEHERIAAWPVDDPVGLFAYLKLRWTHGSWGWHEEEEMDEPNSVRFLVSTGGWSGNESLIAAFERNVVLWGLCAVQWRRGGHYVFELPSWDAPQWAAADPGFRSRQ